MLGEFGEVLEVDFGAVGDEFEPFARGADRGLDETEVVRFQVRADEEVAIAMADGVFDVGAAGRDDRKWLEGRVSGKEVDFRTGGRVDVEEYDLFIA